MTKLEIRHTAGATEFARSLADGLEKSLNVTASITEVQDIRCLQGFRARVASAAYWQEYDSSVVWYNNLQST